MLFQRSVKSYCIIFLQNLIETIKNITNRLNFDEFQIDGISTKFSAESTKKYIPVRKSSLK